uniref:Uncharacterized protein n=1 Tax=viral metagenome TaxID=1070528 RepID=A0A6C0AQY6_9ZZZZ
MGIDLYCIEQTFSCSYTYWHNIRNSVIKATFTYISIEINSDKITDNNEVIYVNDLKNIIDQIERQTKDGNYLGHFVKMCHSIPNINCLIYFGLEGLASFCNKNDCEGFYSVADSYSICELFKTIKPYLVKNMEVIESNDNHIYCSIEKLEKVFEESFEKRTNITIT